MRMRLALASLALCLVAMPACSSSSSRDSNDRELTIVKPVDQTIRRGETNKVAIVIARDNFQGPVAVRFEGLPPGVRVVEVGKSIGSNENIANFTLQADSSADLVNDHLVKITVEGPDRLKTSESFELTVKDRI